MKSVAPLFGIIGIGLVLTGCQKAPDQSMTSNESTPTPASVVVSAGLGSSPAADSPANIVAQFYNALRSGDETTISSLLTDKAREETTRSGLDISSQGSASLSYAVGEIDYIDIADKNDGAHVRSLWTETDDAGGSITSEVIWVLRRQNNGWRIAGMATPIRPGELPELFNFEDPEAMLRKKEYIESELEQEAEQPATQVADPMTPDADATQLR